MLLHDRKLRIKLFSYTRIFYNQKYEEMRLLYEHMLKQKKENDKTAAAAAATAAAATAPPCQCQPSNPELSSLIDYLNKYNYSSIYGPTSNFIFLWNVCTNQIPPPPPFQLLAPPKFERMDRRPARQCYLWGAFRSIGKTVGQWVGKEVSSEIQGQPVSLGICKNDSRFTFFSFCLKVTHRLRQQTPKRKR
jgi:hypothetical protein